MSGCIERCFFCWDSEARGKTVDNWLQVECRRCGEYKLDLAIEPELRKLERDVMASGVLLHRSLFGSPMTITADNYKDVSRSAPKTVDGKIQAILRYIEKKTTSIGIPVRIETEQEYTAGFARTGAEFGQFIQYLRHRGFIEPRVMDGCQLTVDGWREAEKSKSVASNKAFVAMWFKPEVKPAYTEAIKPAIEAAGFNPYRVDEIEHLGKIDDRIVVEIAESRFVVADFTGHRGGVYFEAGYAMGLGIPIIWTCRQNDMRKMHFDIRQYNCLDWKDEADLKERLFYRIRSAVGVGPDYKPKEGNYS